MRKSPAWLGLGFVVLAASWVACAKGGGETGFTDLDPTNGSGSGHGSTHATTSSSDASTGTSLAESTSASGEPQGAGGFGGGFGGAGGGADTSVGGASASSSAASSSSTGGGCTFDAPDTCITAEDLGSVDGDGGSDTKVSSGTTSKWLRVAVHEGSDLPTSLSYTASLEVPAGVDFELFVYPGDADGTDCNASPTQAFGTPRQISDGWDDSYFGHDDSRVLTFEIRYVSGGTCGPSSQWTFTIEGNT